MLDFLTELLFGTEPIAAVQHFFGLGHPAPFKAMSLLADTWGMIGVVGLALWIWGREAAYGTAGAVALAAGTKVLLTEVIFSGPRPEGTGIVVYEQLATGSFPSGHLYHIVGIWGWLYAVRRVPWAMPVLLALLVGLGRFYLATHYLGDILAGILFGIGFAWAYDRLWPPLRAWLAGRSTGFFVGLGLVGIAAPAATLIYSSGSAHRWEVVGVAVGLVLGLWLEYRYVRFRPARISPGRAALKVTLGLGGILLCLMLNRLAGEQAYVLNLTTAALGGLWAVWGAPWLFTRFGWSTATRAGTDL